MVVLQLFEFEWDRRAIEIRKRMGGRRRNIPKNSKVK